MMDKGSNLKSKAERTELLRTMAEFTEKLETDPYQPGVVHPNLCGDDLQDIIEDVMWIREFNEITIRIKKEPMESTLSVEVTERKH
jgi:hypothetical protein